MLILREVASRCPSVLADILVIFMVYVVVEAMKMGMAKFRLRCRCKNP